LAFISWLRALGSREVWQYLLALMLSMVIVVGMLVAGLQLSGLRIVTNQMMLGGSERSTTERIIIDATAGFQNSGIYLQKGQRVALEPEGRIHLAIEQLHNLTRSIKPLIVQGLPERSWPESIKNRYPLPDFKNDQDIFYRDWVGPEGESFQSDILEDCKLRKDLNWGALMTIVMPTEVLSQTDPFEVLQSNQLTANQLISVPSKTEIIANRDGWLTFIVNEAVISPFSTSKDARDYYDALKAAVQELSGTARYKVHLRSVPLTWFSDNAGTFRVKVHFVDR
jgi:hypothetical protein